MDEMHKWQAVYGRMGAGVLRLSVPNGWLYVVDDSEAKDIVSAPVFVPARPRLVALEMQSGDDIILVNPAAVLLIAKDTYPAREGQEPIKASRVDIGDSEDASIYVKGTPAEVAARLGLEVQP